MLGFVVVVLGVVAAAFVILANSSASLVSDPAALAKVNMPLGGGKIESVVAITGPTSRRVPIQLRGDTIWPVHSQRAGKEITIQVVVRRPGYIRWLSGSQQRLQLTVRTPAARLGQSYLTLKPSAPLRVRFTRPVSVIAYGARPGDVTRHVLPSPTSVVTLARTAQAGTIWIAGMAESWEHASPQIVSWFPSGAATAAVANPAPGTQISPTSSIALTFSKPVARALGHSFPPVSPAGAGSWHQVGSHTLVFQPQAYGYGLGATVKIGLPASVRLVGDAHGPAGSTGTWTVRPGSTLRLQQMLSMLGYLPLKFSGRSVPSTPGAEEDAAIHPPSGTFSWRYANVPAALRNMWAPGDSGVMTRGAIMAFENTEGMTTDGIASPQVWQALIKAVIAGHSNSFGYSFVQVSEGSPETENTWHNGRTVESGLVNTGIPAAPTAQGVFAVFEHAPSVTMSGTNPDGTPYSDPGVPYVSYFNGGDALHGFIRASYGFPQSLGCVEMPYSEAAAVYPYTPIGTLVDVS